jgi:mono/diheme cytochrome c family protein
VRRALPLLGALLLLAGCGTGGKAPANADQANGQKLFTSAGCGGRHARGCRGGRWWAPTSTRVLRLAEAGLQGEEIENVARPDPPGGADAEEPRQGPGCRTSLPTSRGRRQCGAKPHRPVGNDGKAIFQADCASCHTLAAAKATGTIGPNLDQLKPSEAIAKHQVEVGGGVMPAFKGKLTDAQIAAVAKFVSSSAGK